MANQVDIRTQTRNFLEANLPSGLTVAKIEYPNTQIKRSQSDYWLRVFWANVGIVSRDATHSCEIDEGIMYIDLNIPKFKVIDPEITKMEILRKLFLNNTFLDVYVESAEVKDVGNVGDWYVVQIKLTFQYEEFLNA